MARIATSHDLELAYKNYRERAPPSLACVFAERNGMDNRYSNFILKSFQDFFLTRQLLGLFGEARVLSLDVIFVVVDQEALKFAKQCSLHLIKGNA